MARHLHRHLRVAELGTLPLPTVRDAGESAKAAIAAGEMLADMAAYWAEASAEQRQDMVWALLTLGGLVYDLQRQMIGGLVPRPDILPLLSLALGTEWEQQEDGSLSLREAFWQVRATRSELPALQEMPPTGPTHLHLHNASRRWTCLLRSGHTPRQVADALGVSYWVILRLLRRTAPALLPKQQEPKLYQTQADEARALLASGWSLRTVGKHFGVSYGAIWRQVQRDRAADRAQHPDEQTGTQETP